MEFALWNRAAVMQLIECECSIKLSVRDVGNYLRRWGFTPQKPVKKVYEQRPEAVKVPRATLYPWSSVCSTIQSSPSVRVTIHNPKPSLLCRNESTERPAVSKS